MTSPAIGTREWFEAKDALPHGSAARLEMGLAEMKARSALPYRRGHASYFQFEIEEGERLYAEISKARAERQASRLARKEQANEFLAVIGQRVP